jgi:hypothetical protein
LRPASALEAARFVQNHQPPVAIGSSSDGVTGGGKKLFIVLGVS